MQPATIAFEDGIVGEMCLIFKMKANCGEEVCAVCCEAPVAAGGRCDVFSLRGDCGDLYPPLRGGPQRFFVCPACSHGSNAVKYICCSMRNPFRVFLQNANNDALHELESFQNIAR